MMGRELRHGLGICLVVVLSILGMSQGAAATLIYGDIAGGNNVFSGYNLGPGNSSNNSIAEGFTMTQSYNLESVDLYLSQFLPQAGSDIALSIYSNNGGNNPGTDLYDLSTNITLAVNGPVTQVNFTGTGSFSLTTGTKYWLVLYATNPASPTGSNVEWDGEYKPDFSAPAVPAGPGATEVGQLRSIGSGNPPSGSPSTSELRTAFQLNGSPTPEPSSLLLGGLGALGLLATRRRQRR